MAANTKEMPNTGDSAPEISLPAGDETVVSLSGLRGKPVVVYFYPKDDTPGCTVEAKGFEALGAEFAKAGAEVLGISPDSPASHCKFQKKYGLGFRLLSDQEHRAAEAYGVWVEKSMYGKTYMGIQRATFLVDAAGNIAHRWPKVKPEGHAEEVLEAVRGL